MKTMTREEWLNKLAGLMAPWFVDVGHPLPAKYRISCGWPSRRALASSKGRSIGQCWSPEASKDATTEMFVSPCLDDAVEVGAVLVHELVHAAVGTQAGHKGAFRAVALQIGLEGKMTATHAGKELTERLNALVTKVGAYPHAELDQSKSPIKKQGTRLVKIVCPACGYTCRTTHKWIDLGLPTCCCGEQMEQA